MRRIIPSASGRASEISMNSGDFDRMVAEGRALRDRLIYVLEGSKNDTPRQEEFIRRLKWPLHKGTRVYDPAATHSGQLWKVTRHLRLDIRSGQQVVEIVFDDDTQFGFRFDVHCNGGRVLNTRKGADATDAGTAEDLMALFATVMQDFDCYSHDTPWPPYPERRTVQDNDPLVLRQI